MPDPLRFSSLRGLSGRVGVASADEMDLVTLADRLEREHQEVGGTIVWDLAFLVSARVAPAQ